MRYRTANDRAEDDHDRMLDRTRRDERATLSTRYLLYSHDGVGLGHTSRNLAIARALVAEDSEATVLLATGSDDALQLGVPERVEVLKLPSLRKLGNESYAARRLRVSPADIHRIRAGLLMGAVEGFQPDVMLVDKHPLGAGGELRGALECHRGQGGAAVLGLRDILDEPETVRAEWAVHDLGRCIATLYDRLLIYGQRSVFDPVTEYGLPPELEALSVFCGYVARDDRAGAGRAPVEETATVANGKPVVMATVGGGEDGTSLLAAFLEASGGAPWQAVAVTGPQAPEAVQARLDGLAERSGVVMHRFLPDLGRRLSAVDVLVCMGGYNTLAEAMGHGLPVVCVPRVHPRKEQWLRAKAFERLGLLECVGPETLTSGTLREAIRRALRQSRVEVSRRCFEQIHLNGGPQAAVELGRLAREGLARRISGNAGWVVESATETTNWVQA